MTVDKILVIVVLIFSVVFVVAAINGYDKAHDQQQKGTAAINARDRQIAEDSTQISTLQGDNKDLIKTGNDLNEALKKALSDLAGVTADRDALKIQLKDEDGKVTALQGQINTLNQTITTLQGSVNDYNKQLQTIIADRDQLKTALEAAKISINDLTTQLGAANKTSSDKDATIADLKEQLRNALHPEQGGTKHPELNLDCTVIKVTRGAAPLVALDKGGKAGLKEGMQMFVWNSQENYKGKITIVEVKDDTAFARIDHEEPGKEIKEGDTASVQNF